MNDKMIEKSICLELGCIDSRLRTHIYSKLCKDLVGKCEKEHGYIFGVDKEFKILGNHISTAGPGVFFTIQTNIETLKPEVGKVYEGVVCMILQLGLFIEVEGKMKILVQTVNLNGYKFDKITNTFKKNDKSIKQKDKVKVQLTMERYEKQSFSCVGKLV